MLYFVGLLVFALHDPFVVAQLPNLWVAPVSTSESKKSQFDTGCLLQGSFLIHVMHSLSIRFLLCIIPASKNSSSGLGTSFDF